MKTRFILYSLVFIIVLASCKKDDDNNINTTGIEGTYKFKYIDATTSSTTTGDDGEKVISAFDYTTINNQGTFVFGNSSAAYTDLTYSVDAEIKSNFYMDDVLLDSSSLPVTATLPVTSGTSPYILIGADSIYFPQGSVTYGGIGGSSGPTIANGGRYSVNGNLLTIIQHISRDSTFEDSGVNFTLKESGIATTVLEKQ